MALETRLKTKMEHKSLRDSRIFTNSLVVILGVTSGLFLKEKIGKRLALALAAAMTGAIVLSLNAGLSFQEITGPLAVVFSAFMYSVFAVGSKPLVKEYGALPTAIWIALIGTAFTLPLI